VLRPLERVDRLLRHHEAGALGPGFVSALCRRARRLLAAVLLLAVSCPCEEGPAYEVVGALEGEKLEVLAVTGGKVQVQEMGQFEGFWSGGRQLWWTGGQPGDQLDLAFAAAETGWYRIEGQLTKARDYGIVQVSFDGQKQARLVDLFDEQVVPTGKLNWALAHFKQGRHTLSLRITGANPKALPLHMVGLDYIRLAPPDSEWFPDPEIRIDTTEVPELAEWAGKAACELRKWYPVFAEKLSAPGFVPPRVVSVTIKKDMKGIAFTAEGRIVCASAWFKAHLDDTGALLHELVHVLQAWPKPEPWWVVEGIADYLRFHIAEPKRARDKLDPERVRYQDGYQPAAAFLAWIEQVYDPLFVRKLNQACRVERYDEAIFEQRTGKRLDELWQEFRATLKP
jgi:hypothetical protein